MEYQTQQQLRNQKTKHIMFWAAVVVVVVGGAWGVYRLSKSSQKQITAKSTELSAVTTADHVRGADNARVTIVEYSDFQCPACAAAEPVIQKILSDYSGSVKIAYRYFPLVTVHQNALLSSAAAEAAGKQGKFWEMHDLLFAKQSEWSENSNAASLMLAYAQGLGLNAEQFQKDLTSKETSQMLLDAYNHAVAVLKLDHTPTIFIDGTELTDTSYNGFKQLIDLALK